VAVDSVEVVPRGVGKFANRCGYSLLYTMVGSRGAYS
jgi:hypothetical protein